MDVEVTFDQLKTLSPGLKYKSAQDVPAVQQFSVVDSAGHPIMGVLKNSKGRLFFSGVSQRLKDRIAEVTASPAPAPVATPARDAAMKDLGGVGAKTRPLAKALPAVSGNALLGLEAEQKAAMESAEPVAAAPAPSPVAAAVKGVVTPPVAPAPSEPPRPRAAAPAPATAPAPAPAPVAAPAPITGRRYQDPVQAALWQARTDALQRYYANQNWGSVGADQLSGVMGSYVNASSHKKNGQELVYDAAKDEWVDVTPIDMGDEKAWRKFAGKDYKDQAKRWDWAWQQAHPAAQLQSAESFFQEHPGGDYAKVQAAHAAQVEADKKAREEALARHKANTVLIARTTKEDRDIFGPGRTWFGGEPGSSSMGEVLGSLGRPRVTSDRRTKRLIKALSRRF